MSDEQDDELGARAATATRRAVWTMLLSAVVAVVGAIAIVSTTGNDATAVPHHRAAATATHKIVLRPVTERGTAAPGYRVVLDHRAPIECFARSAVAVDAAVVDCGSTADYTVACWAAHTPGRVVCLTDPFSHVLRSIRLSGAFPATARPSHASPQALRLADGGRYLVRAGGAWSAPKDHPSWVGWYFERASFTHALYGPVRGDGIDRNAPRWTVSRYAATPTHATRVAVIAAYYVGTNRTD